MIDNTIIADTVSGGIYNPPTYENNNVVTTIPTKKPLEIPIMNEVNILNLTLLWNFN